MSCTKQFTANYSPLTYKVTTAVEPANAGEVTIKPLQPDEGYAFGTQVTVTAKPASGFAFKEWSGTNLHVTSNPFSLVVTVDKQIKAVFVEKQSSSIGWIIGGASAGIIVIGLLLYFLIFRKPGVN
jgi:hypothetical protein